MSVILHGVYDWLAGIQPTMAALLAGFSFALFYGYLIKLRDVGGLHSGVPPVPPEQNDEI